MLLVLAAAALLAGGVNSSNSTIPGDAEDTCEGLDQGLWSCALEDWATSTLVQSDRHGRVMALPSTKGYYVAERIDTPFLSPPPLPPSQSKPTTQLHITQPSNHPPQGPGYNPHGGGHAPLQGTMTTLHNMHVPPGHAMHVPQGYKEWESPSAQPGSGKIVNRPPNPYKDKFKPSYPLQQQQGHRPSSTNTIDRVDDPPRKQVTETDLYLLSAIEKLVYRVDLMEKRLRKMEEGVHSLLAGVETKPEPCAENFTRVGSVCYEFAGGAQDWKGASLACRRRGAALLELTDRTQRSTLYSKLLSDSGLRGNDFWTGGLNPGLLWIWSHSAKPVEANSTNSTSIAGDGRCLALVLDPTRNSYVYRGQDCAVQHRYICQKEEDKEKLSNEIQRVARKLRSEKPRKSKLLWDNEHQ